MSTKEVYDYVMHTPRNTNPAVLNSMLGHLSWNDLKDKPFYSEVKEEVILEQQSFTFYDDADEGEYMFKLPHPLNFPSGASKAVVFFDGQEYSATVIDESNGWYYIVGEDLPFFITSSEEGGWTIIKADQGTHEIGITYTNETVHKLDGKYVKGMGYTETSKEVIFPETEFSFEHSISTQSERRMVAGDFKLVVGNKYEVFFDGVKYECIAHSVYDDMGSVCLGTYNEFGEANFPFFVLYVEFPDYETFFDENLIVGIPSPAETVYHTFEIVGDVEIIHTIEPKYLPCDLMFKVGCTGTAHPNMNPANMTKPTIVSGSLEAVLEKLANGEIPVVKVQYMGVWDKTNSVPLAYGGEFACGTWLYNTSIIFDHFIACGHDQYSVRIALDIDDSNFVEMQLHPIQAYMSPIIIID